MKPDRRIVVAVLVTLVVCAFLVSGWLMNADAYRIDNLHWMGSPLPPCFVDVKTCGGHILGTDEVGRDLLARLIVGANVSIGISFVAVLVELAIAVTLGVLSRFGGLVATFVVDCVLESVSSVAAWPIVLVVVEIVAWATHRNALSWIYLAALAAALFSPNITRRVRLAKDLGDHKGFFNQAGRDWASILLLLATVDFFGYGVFPPTPSWGNMLSSVQSNLQTAWWAAVFPAVCLAIAAFFIDQARRAFFDSGATF